MTQEPLSGETLAETAQRWSQRKATAALLLTEDAVLRAEAEAALDAVGVPVVVLGDKETRTVYAAMDERQAGMLLADFAKAYGRVYLVGDAPQRLEGALSALRQEQAVTGGNALPAPGEDACVVALTGKETRRLAAMREAGKLTARLVGMDPGEERVQLMAEGAVETPYALGYMAMQMALSGETEACLLPYKLVVPSEMYDAKNVKLMFPLLH